MKARRDPNSQRYSSINELFGLLTINCMTIIYFITRPTYIYHLHILDGSCETQAFQDGKILHIGKPLNTKVKCLIKEHS